MWEYNGTDDSTLAIRGGFYEGRSLKDMLSLMFRGEASDFFEEPRVDGFSAYKPIRAKSPYSFACLPPTGDVR